MADSCDLETENIGTTHHELLIGLKSTIEGLLATHSINVWNTYGGLNRVCNQVDLILRHRIRESQHHFRSDSDYWPFVQGLKWLSPVLAPSIERLNKLSQTCEDDGKGITWLRESLHDHMLSRQLEVLVKNPQHLHNFYHSDAFLCSPAYFQAMVICLKAVELNKVALLAEINPALLSGRHRTNSHQRSHTRSASLPINQVTPDMKHQDRDPAPPPFSSPGKESFLSTSDEHTVDIQIASSPQDQRISGKEGLRSVLKKSGGELLALTSSPPTHGFSFYERIHSDPLLNVDFPSNRDTLVSPVFFDSSSYQGLDTTDEGGKPIARRCKSHGDNSIPVLNGQSDIFIPNKKKTMQKSSKNVSNNCDDEKKRTKKESSTLGHKRSRSDMSGIKPGSSSQMVFTNAVANDNSGSQSDSTIVEPSTLPSAPVIKEPVKQSGYDLFPFVLRRLKTPTGGRMDGRLQPPAQGQSLMSYLSSQDFHTCANLDKENAHFSISEALIAAIEQMKWNHVISPARMGSDIEEEGDSDEEIQQLKQRIRIRRRERQKEKARGFPAFSDGRTDTTATSTSSPLSSSHDLSEYSDSYDSSDEVDDEEIELTLSGTAEEHQSNLSMLKSSGLSLSMASLYSDADLHRSNHALDKSNSVQESILSGGSTMSAESVAISLLRKFSEKQLPKASDLVWLVSEQDAPQALLPLPNSYPVSPDDGENADLLRSTNTRLRGNLEWAPPRPQIIFNIHPAPKRSVVLARQNYRCAGCGMKVEAAYVKRFRYCEYLGKFFCQCCHSNSLDYVPGRILRKWDFTKYGVSNFAHDLLAKIHRDPLFDIVDINPTLFRRVKNLDIICDCRKQLFHLKSFLRVCRQGSSLQDDIMKLPRHWVEEMTVFSMEDLVHVKSGEMLYQLKNIVHNCLSHIQECPLCQGLGFICELCNNRDIIFPFQLDKVQQCPDCHACYHKSCYSPGKCPKCSRIELRRQRLAQQSVAQDDYMSDTDSGNDSAEPGVGKS